MARVGGGREVAKASTKVKGLDQMESLLKICGDNAQEKLHFKAIMYEQEKRLEWEKNLSTLLGATHQRKQKFTLKIYILTLVLT